MPEDAAELERDLEELRREVDRRDSQVDWVWPRVHRLEEHIASKARGQLLIDYAVWTSEHLRYQCSEKDTSLSCPWNRVHSAATKGRPDGREEDLATDIATIMRHAHGIFDEDHLAANESRSRLLTAGWAAATVSGTIILAAIFMPQLPFLVGTEDYVGIPHWQVVLLVALGGVVGGCWGAFPAFTSATRDRFRLQYARAFTRLAMGVLSALLGVSLMGAGWVADLTAGAAPSLFAVAVAFGLAQEPVTRILEQKADQARRGPSDAATESHAAE